RTHLDEAEPRGEQWREHAGVLVEASGHAEWIGEVEAKHRLGEARIVRLSGARIKPKLEAQNSKVMRPLRIERVEQGLAEAEESVHPATPSGRTCQPSAPTRSGSTESTWSR